MAKKETIKSFVLRVDAETMEAIEKWAADEFRSTNGQLQWIIAEALRKSGRMKKKRIERAVWRNPFPNARKQRRKMSKKRRALQK